MVCPCTWPCVRQDAESRGLDPAFPETSEGYLDFYLGGYSYSRKIYLAPTAFPGITK